MESHEWMPRTDQAIAADRLSNLLTGLVIKCGVLSEKADESPLQAELKEIAALANECALLLRKIVPI